MEWRVISSANIVATNLRSIRSRMRMAAERSGRSPDAVTLVGITKGQSIDAVRSAYDLGLRHFGENYVQELEKKRAELPADITWHYVGHLQRNKVRALLAPDRTLFSIDSVDSARLAEHIESIMRDHAPNSIRILLQVKLGSEDTKSGVAPADLPSLLAAARSQAHLNIAGLMTMPPPLPAEQMRPYFRVLATLARTHGLRDLSMGMSDDFEVAIEEGATEVRIGTALFGERQ